MSIFDVNRSSIHEHINISKSISLKWYEQLGASSSTLYTYGTTANQIEYYDAKTKSIKYKNYDCIKLNGDVTLSFNNISLSELDNYYVFLKYYYIKGDSASSIYRWQYSNIDNNSIENYSTKLGMAFKMAVDGTVLLPKGEYSLNGWELVKISKDSVKYYYKDGEHIISCHRDSDNKVKNNYNNNSIIKPSYNADVFYGEYAHYSIPAYGINSDCIRLYGDINNKSIDGNFQNNAKNGINYYYYDSNDKKQDKGTSYNSLYFREATIPIMLFNDFCWGSDGTEYSIPSSSNPLEVKINNEKTEITISYKGQTQTWKLYEDDKIIFYTREPVEPFSVPTVCYGRNSNGNKYACILMAQKNHFIAELNNIKIYDFYNIYNNSVDSDSNKTNYDSSLDKWILKDNISYENVNIGNISSIEKELYKKIIITDKYYTKSREYKTYNFSKKINKNGNYYLYQSEEKYNDQRFDVKNMDNKEITYLYSYFDCKKIKTPGYDTTGNYLLDELSYPSGYMNLSNISKGAINLYTTEDSTHTITEWRSVTINNIQYIPLNSPFYAKNNKYTINQNNIDYEVGSTNPDTGQYRYYSHFRDEIKTSIGMIKSNVYFNTKLGTLTYNEGLGAWWEFNPNDSSVINEHQLSCTVEYDNLVKMTCEHNVKVNYYDTNKPKNVDQPAIAIVLWTHYEEH